MICELANIMSPFRKRVYRAVKMIPAGRVTTYKRLADFLGCASAQAVGQALKNNPYAPEVPCHRVIRGDLRIGGFAGETTGTKITEKESLLAAEGVSFIDGRLAEPWRLVTLS